MFTDSSGKTGTAGITWQDKQGYWQKCSQKGVLSTQKAELAAIILGLQTFAKESCNIISDSSYAVQLVRRIYEAVINAKDHQLMTLLFKLQQLMLNRQHACYTAHVRSHSKLPGPISLGNFCADIIISSLALNAARSSHNFYHLNYRALMKEFQLTKSQAQDIIRACPDCQQVSANPYLIGINPRGLIANELQQTNITHVPEFGRQKFVHVSLDTFPRMIFAFAHTGKKTKRCQDTSIRKYSIYRKT